jgi:hypothetical protein
MQRTHATLLCIQVMRQVNFAVIGRSIRYVDPFPNTLVPRWPHLHAPGQGVFQARPPRSGGSFPEHRPTNISASNGHAVRGCGQDTQKAV